ncbi:MAG: tRNA pseudouridine(38-40) synthase TruA, partial [Candidatus Acidiferrum sp.]
ILAYDGSDFHGWQTQPERRTVQQTIEEAIAKLIGDTVRVNASGRTDSGVHAVGQAVNFHCDTKLAADVFVRGLNAHLPEDIVVMESKEMGADFDAQRDAKRKLYRYVVHDGAVPDLFMRKYCHHSRYAFDADAMKRSAECLRGKHDFACFESEWPNRASSVRTINHIALSRFGDWLWLDVEADGFLYNMVRAIAGSLMNVGRGFWPAEKLVEILASRDRHQAGPTAPPQGLFLMRVTYDQK